MTQATVIHLPQLGASPAEPLASAITAELMAKGQMRSATYSWEDQAHAAIWHGQVVGLIAWRVQKWNAAAFISLGGVASGFRRQGIYRGLWDALVAHLAENEPAVIWIDSGHHIENHESRAMHEAFGRRLDAMSYTYRVRDL